MSDTSRPLKGCVHHLVTNNFKSYKGEHTIGPFNAEFTAIIGCNGSGKSNLMDAISFVAGVKIKHMRGDHFKDLVYDGDKQAEATKRTAFVTLAYKVGAGEVSDMQEGEMLEFTRHIAANGTSTYEIDGRRATQAAYTAKFEAIGVLVDARNFLVFQGDVESLAQMSSDKLREYFEIISGSGLFKQEYDRAKQEKDDYEAMALAAIQRKKEVNAEKKEAKDQQEETRRHRELIEQRDAQKAELALYQVRQEQEVIRKTQTDLADARDAVVAAERLEAAMNEELVEAKAQNATGARDVSKAEAALAKLGKSVTTLTTALAKKAEAAQRAKTKRRENDAQLKSAREGLAKQQEEIKSIQDAIAGLNVREAELGQQASTASASTTLELSDDQQVRLAELRKRADKETAETRDQIDRLVREATTLHESLDEHRRSDEQLQARLDEIETERAMLVKRKTKMDASIASLEQKVAEGKKAEEAEKTKAAEVKQAIEAKRVELEEARATLNNAKARSNDSKRARKTAEVLQALTRHFEGVKGRVVDLCRPTQRKFATAVEVALGRYMDAIVVTREAVALECIKYLRDQRLGVATFLPLDSLQVKPVKADRRALHGPYRLCIDVLEVDDEEVMRAIHFACGDTIICDSLKDARTLCFAQGMRVKTVSLEGHQISARGDMTGGATLESRGGDRFAETATQTARETRDRLEREIAELERQVAATASDADVQTTNALNRLKFAQTDCKATEAKIADAEQRIKAARLALDQAKPKRDELEGKLAQLAAQQTALQADVARIEDDIFAEFGSNLKEIRALERREAEEGGKRRAMLAEVREQRSKLESQLRYVEAKDRSEAVAEAERLASASSAAAEATAEEAAQAKAQLEDAQAQVAQAEAALEKLLADIEALVSKVKEAQARTAQAGKDRGAAVKRVTQIESELTKAVARKNEIVKQAEMDDVALAVQGDAFDFSNLPNRPKTKADADAAEQAYLARIKELNAQIDLLAPNARAEAKLQEAIARLKDSDAVLQEARDKAKDAEKTFNRVRQQRYDAYMAMFNKVAECIDGIYKELTKRVNAPLGGSAFLALEDAGGLDPFLAGVKYDVSPPNKRFRPMDQLSGGEKTVAALALLFAVHAFRPPPFFVMDEIDAALDNDNVGRVASYVRRRSRRNHDAATADELPVQCLVISLKDNFFDRADALVGVYRDVKEETSRSLTMDLTPFPIGA